MPLTPPPTPPNSPRTVRLDQDIDSTNDNPTIQPGEGDTHQTTPKPHSDTQPIKSTASSSLTTHIASTPPNTNAIISLPHSSGTITPESVGDKDYLADSTVNHQEMRHKEIAQLREKIGEYALKPGPESAFMIIRCGIDLAALELIPSDIADIVFAQTHQMNIKANNDHLQTKPLGPMVKRFGIEAEKLKSLLNNFSPLNTLHYIEQEIFEAAFSELRSKSSAATYQDNLLTHYPNNAVVVDMFVRPQGSIKEYEKREYVNGKEIKTKMGFPETHSIVLWRKKDKEFVIIDPSNSDFSQHIRVIIESQKEPFLLDEEKIVTYVPPGGKTIYSIGPTSQSSNIPTDWTLTPRDCTDIAIKICFELNEGQVLNIPLENIELSVAWQISNLLVINQNLQKLMDRTLLTGLQSSDKNIRWQSLRSTAVISVLLSTRQIDFITKINELMQKQDPQTNKKLESKDLPWVSQEILEQAAHGLLVEEFYKLQSYEPDKIIKPNKEKEKAIVWLYGSTLSFNEFLDQYEILLEITRKAMPNEMLEQFSIDIQKTSLYKAYSAAKEQLTGSSDILSTLAMAVLLEASFSLTAPTNAQTKPPLQSKPS